MTSSLSISEKTSTETSTAQTSRFPACLLRLGAFQPRRRGAAFYLSAEEYIAREMPAGNYFFSWILPPTVVMGRNQVAEAELNLDFCHSEAIDIVRRKSGGGCIYADEGNVMFSLVTTAGDVETLFADYATHVAAALTDMSVRAHVSGRNDVLLENGTKVCGNAFYHLAQRNIVHGTMLYDTDVRRMSGALTPNQLKVTAHSGVKSVRSRIGLIKDICPMGVEALRHGIEQRLCNRTTTLTDDDIRKIEVMEQSYHNPSYIYGQRVQHQAHTLRSATQRIEGCGTLTLTLHIATDGRISEAQLSGDFFALVSSATQDFDRAFRTQFPTATTLRNAATAHQLHKTVRGLSAAKLFELIDATCEATLQ